MYARIGDRKLGKAEDSSQLKMNEWDKAIEQVEEIVAEIQRDVSGVDARRYYAEKFLSLVEIKAEDQSLPDEILHEVCQPFIQYLNDKLNLFSAIYQVIKVLRKADWMRVVKE